MKKKKMRFRKFYSPTGKIYFIAICCFIAAVSCGCVKTEIININSSGENIICFGDSISFGYGVAKKESYPVYLAKILNKPVINAGVDGDTSRHALQRLETDVLKQNPLLVVIQFGGNDFVKRLPLEETVSNVEEMIRKIQEAGAMVALADPGASFVMSDYGKEFKRLSKTNKTIFIPQILKGILTNPSFKSDFVHPNAEGYKIIAHRVYRAIIPYLNKNAIIRRFGK